MEIPSMRILAESELEWAKQRYEQLNLIDEKQLTALCHGQCYQQRMARAFNARVRHREFNPGDLVLRKVLHITPDSRGKFAYKYDGPFVVKETFSEGAIILSDMDGTENALPVNANAIKKTELKKIEDKNAREVTFSKRKGGLLKKASELALLCGVDIVINTYSPHGNPFVYSKSSGDAIFRRFVGSTSTVGDDFNVMPLSCEDRLNEYRQQEREALSRLEEARKHQQANGNGKPRW
ncbi:uncharacterized protein LOC116200437 [Punica granatum]|uniref:Uncharacterized protein LOC116200437 n=1 Tax=Punica granatum TaxID=22663 RepID=A0A6P8CRH0_PUNGR|nr:uncharacterized protein LOC116200437 [Punica granatum]